MPTSPPYPTEQVVSPPLVETENPNDAMNRSPGDPTINWDSSGQPAERSAAVSMTQPPNPTPQETSDPAFVPSPHQQYPQQTDTEWMTPEFKQRAIDAAFPGSPVGDEAFLHALYKFESGGTPAGEGALSRSGRENIATGTPPVPVRGIDPGYGQEAPVDPGYGQNEPRRPEIDRLEPDSGWANHDLDLTVRGSGFTNGSKIWFNDKEQETRYVSDSELVASIKADALPNTGPIKVRVEDQVGRTLERDFTAT